MNARIGQALNCYGAIEAKKLTIERMGHELQSYVNVLTEKEMSEYLAGTEKIDQKTEARR